MPEFVSKEELIEESNSSESQEKIPAFSGKRYPIEYLDSRDFERLVYFLFQHEIGEGKYLGVFDTIALMKGTAERGRDCVLQHEGNNVGVIQCRRYVHLVTLPDLCREIIKFLLHSIQDSELITNSGNFTYYFVALKGLNDKASEYARDFSTKIKSEEKLKEWTEEVIEENELLKFKGYEEVQDNLLNLLSKIKLRLLTGDDLNLKLKNAKTVVTVFFEVEKVVNEQLLRAFGESYLGFKSNEDLEKLRARLQNIPNEKIMKFGLFSLYGYDKNFFKKLTSNRDIFYQIANVKLAISKLFIDYLREQIEKYILIFISGLPNISPFTKQVASPYLFNRFALAHMRAESGDFLMSMSKRKDSYVVRFQTVHQIKEHLLETGQAVLNSDYSSFVGDDELVALKKNLAEFIHRGFKSVDEMSEQFDKDMIVLQPILDTIDREIEKIMPQNATLLIENTSSMQTEDDFVNSLKEVSKLNK